MERFANKKQSDSSSLLVRSSEILKIQILLVSISPFTIFPWFSERYLTAGWQGHFQTWSGWCRGSWWCPYRLPSTRGGSEAPRSKFSLVGVECLAAEVSLFEVCVCISASKNIQYGPGRRGWVGVFITAVVCVRWTLTRYTSCSFGQIIGYRSQLPAGDSDNCPSERSLWTRYL